MKVPEPECSAEDRPAKGGDDQSFYTRQFEDGVRTCLEWSSVTSLQRQSSGLDILSALELNVDRQKMDSRLVTATYMRGIESRLPPAQREENYRLVLESLSLRLSSQHRQSRRNN